MLRAVALDMMLALAVHAHNDFNDAMIELGASIDGHMLLPGDRRFGRSVKQWNKRFDTKEPSGVVYCASEQDVIDTLVLLDSFPACYTVRSAGHSFPGWSVRDNCTIIDVSGLDAIEYDQQTRVVTVGPGTNFWDFTEALGKVKRTTTHGFGPTVSFGGYTQGGGVGLTHRKYGLAIDNLLSARVILPNGTELLASAASHPDLFWALRGGGGGNWGVVTSYSFKTYDGSSPVMYVMLEWRFSKEIVDETGRIWQQYFVNNTDVDFGFYWRINGNPVLGEVGTKVQIYGIYTGAISTGETVVRHFTELFPTAPHSTEIKIVTIDAAYKRFMKPFKHTPHTGFFLQSRLLSKPMHDEAFSVLAHQLDKLHFLQTFTLIWMDPMGGRVAEVDGNSTAFPWRNAFANFAIFVFYLTDAVQESAASWMEDTWSKLDPSMGDNNVYVNFCFENVPDWQSAYYGENYARLQHVKAKYDPKQRMTFPQSIEPQHSHMELSVV